MSKMHKNELDITEALVRSLLKQQCEEYSNLDLSRIPSSGTVHVLFRLGEQYIIRLPRIEASAGIEKEWVWLKKIAPYLTTPIAEPIYCGKPSKDYPWPWLIGHYYHGENPAFEQENELEQLAIRSAFNNG